MKQNTGLLCSALVAGIVALGSATAARADALVLRGASFTPLETTWGIPFRMFVDHVNETGAGVLQIQPLGPEALPATEQPNALRSGLIDIVATPPGMYKPIVTESNAQDLSDMTLAEQRASGGYDALDALTRARMNAHMLTTYGPGVNFHLYLTREISSVDELQGLRVRSQPIFAPFFASLGLSGTTIPIPETYTALERGVVQGYGFPAWGVQDLGWDGVTRVRVEPGFYNVVVNILVNEERYASLTEAQRQVLDDAAAWFETHMETYMAESAAVHHAAQDAAGIVAVDFGPGFARQAADVYWDELALESPETIADLRALLQH